ncbi:MAG TPA: SRPBCC family protein [Nocardioides sp.]
MAQVTAVAEAAVAAAPADVIAALADYTTTRPAILTDRYTDYAVTEGGTGTGTVVTWRLHATEKRVRHVVAEVTVTGDSVVEKDRNSTLVTTFTVKPSGAGSTVTATTTWQGAGGIGGFFERTFAPKGLRRIHDELLANLAARVSS